MSEYMAGDVPVWFRHQIGTVYGHRQWSETRVSSHGGGGHVGPNGGYVSAPLITSSTEHHQSFWLVSSDGEEREITPPRNFRCREGQKVLLLWGAKEGINRGDYLALHNFNTQQSVAWPEIRHLNGPPFAHFILNMIKYGFILGVISVSLLTVISGSGKFSNDTVGGIFATMFILSFLFCFFKSVIVACRISSLSAGVSNKSLRDVIDSYKNGELSG